MPDQHTTTNISNHTEMDETKNLPFCLRFDVPVALCNITHLRKTSRCLLESLGFSRENRDDVETLIGELSTNVVRHACTESGTYQVSLEFYEERVIITVMDQGTGFSEDSLPPPGTLRPNTLLNADEGEQRIGGLGLPLIHALADHVEIRPNTPHGTTVRAEKTLS